MGALIGGPVIGWERKLIEACEDWAARPFRWGSADCLHFCIACEHAVLGASRLDDFPSYRTEKGGFRHMRKMGFDTIPNFIDTRYDRVRTAAARRGDWVMFEQDDGPAFGVVTGRNAAVMSQSGLVYRPALGAQMAWRVV